MKASIRTLLLALPVLLASGCITQQVKRVNEVQAKQATEELPLEQLLDVTIVAFDPGAIPETAKEQQQKGILPEVRKAEANFLPQVLRQALDGTGFWGTVRVLPEAPPSAMLVVTGKILHSDGETLKLHIGAKDATGRPWIDRDYEETAAALSYTEKTNTADPFQDLYSRIANDLLKQRKGLDVASMQEIRRVADLKFAVDLAPARFDGYLKTDKSGRTKVQRLPPENDPIVKRIALVRARDDALVDTLDSHYAVFRQTMQPAYQDWRRANYNEVIAQHELESAAMWRKVAGAAAVIGGIVAIATSDSGVGQVGGQVGVIGGIGVFSSGLQKGQEAKVHAESVKELNNSISADVAPRVVDLEGKTVTLTGSAQEQYDQWRKLLHERYAAETGTP